MATRTLNKKRSKQYIDKNPVESFRDIGTGVVGSLKNDVLFGSAESFWKQFLGGKTEAQEERFSGELTPGEEIDIAQIQETVKSYETGSASLPGLDYHREIRTFEIKAVRENEGELQKKIAQIQFELKKLVQSSQEVKAIFKQVTVERVPERPGKYHLNFFEWLLSVIKQARLKIDESKSWLATFYARRAKRQYWAMFKKHGTTFGLSSERVVATQTG